jgi:hypothetical protein
LIHNIIIGYFPQLGGNTKGVNEAGRNEIAVSCKEGQHGVEFKVPITIFVD